MTTEKNDLLITYKNYLYALIWSKEFGNKYKDEDMVKYLRNNFTLPYTYIEESPKKKRLKKDS